MAFNRAHPVFTIADRIFDSAASALIIFGGISITVTVVLQVVLRYIFKAPLFGLEELSRLIAVWVYFLGAIFGTKWDAHVQGDVVGRLFHTDRSRAVIKSITWMLSLLVCILFLYHSTTYSYWLYQSGERTTGLWWPRIYSVGSMLFGAFFMTVYSIVNLAKYSADAFFGSESAAGGAS